MRLCWAAATRSISRSMAPSMPVACDTYAVLRDRAGQRPHDPAQPLRAVAGGSVALGAAGRVAGGCFVEGEAELVGERSEPSEDVAQLVQLLVARAFAGGPGQ